MVKHDMILNLQDKEKSALSTGFLDYYAGRDEKSMGK